MVAGSHRGPTRSRARLARFPAHPPRGARHRCRDPAWAVAMLLLGAEAAIRAVVGIDDPEDPDALGSAIGFVLSRHRRRLRPAHDRRTRLNPGQTDHRPRSDFDGGPPASDGVAPHGPLPRRPRVLGVDHPWRVGPDRGVARCRCDRRGTTELSAQSSSARSSSPAVVPVQGPPIHLLHPVRRSWPSRRAQRRTGAGRFARAGVRTHHPPNRGNSSRCDRATRTEEPLAWASRRRRRIAAISVVRTTWPTCWARRFLHGRAPRVLGSVRPPRRRGLLCRRHDRALRGRRCRHRDRVAHPGRSGTDPRGVDGDQAHARNGSGGGARDGRPRRSVWIE